jgi:hypothetical protein
MLIAASLPTSPKQSLRLMQLAEGPSDFGAADACADHVPCSWAQAQ